MTDSITLARPDDWHLHLRDGAGLKAVLADTVQRFARAIVMPNLKPPITTLPWPMPIVNVSWRRCPAVPRLTLS